MTDVYYSSELHKLSNLKTLSLARFQSKFRFWLDFDKIPIKLMNTDKTLTKKGHHFKKVQFSLKNQGISMAEISFKGRASGRIFNYCISVILGMQYFIVNHV